MKKMIVSLAMAMMACLAMNAQSADPDPRGVRTSNQPEREMQKPKKSAEEIVTMRLNMLTKQLNLTDDQQAKVKEILTDQINEEEQLRQLQKQNREKSEAKMDAVLTIDQKKQYDEIKKHASGPRGYDMRFGGKHKHADKGQHDCQNCQSKQEVK